MLEGLLIPTAGKYRVGAAIELSGFSPKRGPADRVSQTLGKLRSRSASAKIEISGLAWMSTKTAGTHLISGKAGASAMIVLVPA